MDVESGIAMIFVGVGIIVAGVMLAMVSNVCPPPGGYPGCLYNPWNDNGVSLATIMLGLFVTIGGSVAFWGPKKFGTQPRP